MEFKLEWFGDQLIDNVKREANEMVEEAAHIVLNNCKPPVRTGKLKESGHVETWPLRQHGTVGASVVYDAPHAHLVHELPVGHELKNGEEKWLERASDRKREEVLRHFEARMGSVLNDGR